jgi:hypothetical protein
MKLCIFTEFTIQAQSLFINIRDVDETDGMKAIQRRASSIESNVETSSYDDCYRPINFDTREIWCKSIGHDVYVQPRAFSTVALGSFCFSSAKNI